MDALPRRARARADERAESRSQASSRSSGGRRQVARFPSAPRQATVFHGGPAAGMPGEEGLARRWRQGCASGRTSQGCLRVGSLFCGSRLAGALEDVREGHRDRFESRRAHGEAEGDLSEGEALAAREVPVEVDAEARRIELDRTGPNGEDVKLGRESEGEPAFGVRPRGRDSQEARLVERGSAQEGPSPRRAGSPASFRSRSGGRASNDQSPDRAASPQSPATPAWNPWKSSGPS